MAQILDWPYLTRWLLYLSPDFQWHSKSIPFGTRSTFGHSKSGFQIPTVTYCPKTRFQNLVGRVQAPHCLWADAEFPLSELKHTSSEFQCFHFGLMPLRRLTARQIPPWRNSRLTGSPRPTKYIRGIKSVLCPFLSRSSLRLSSQISRLRQVTRQMLVYLSTLSQSLGIM